MSTLPVVGNGLVVDSFPVLFSCLAVVQIVAQDVIFVFGLLPLEQCRGVCVYDGHDGVRWSWHS